MDIIVSDAGPLIALVKTGLITLLKKLFKTVYIPEAVLNELNIFDNKPGAKELKKIIENEEWLKVKKISIPHHSHLSLLLDTGEAEAILLSQKLNAVLLIDEKRGRKIAVKYKVKIIGTGRILIAAKEKGYVDNVTQTLHILNNAGYRFSKNLLNKIIKLAKE
jgi:predicted nucleic acid-binding protein